MTVNVAHDKPLNTTLAPDPHTNIILTPFPTLDTLDSQATIKLLQKAQYNIKYPNKPIRIHLDGGANRSITNDISILTNYKNIK